MATARCAANPPLPCSPAPPPALSPGPAARPLPHYGARGGRAGSAGGGVRVLRRAAAGRSVGRGPAPRARLPQLGLAHPPSPALRQLRASLQLRTGARAHGNLTAAPGCLPAGRGRLCCWGAWRCCTSFGGCGGGGTPAAASAHRAGTAAISPTALHLSPKRSVTPPNCRRFLMDALSESWCGAWQARRWVI